MSLLRLCYLESPSMEAFYFLSIWMELSKFLILSACILFMAELHNACTFNFGIGFGLDGLVFLERSLLVRQLRFQRADFELELVYYLGVRHVYSK